MTRLGQLVPAEWITDELRRNIREASARLSDRPCLDERKSPSPENGERVGTLADALTPADIAKWKNMAENGKTKQQRDLARTMLETHHLAQRKASQ